MKVYSQKPGGENHPRGGTVAYLEIVVVVVVTVVLVVVLVVAVAAVVVDIEEHVVARWLI